jgi:hypothetical protein
LEKGNVEEMVTVPMCDEDFINVFWPEFVILEFQN